MSQNPQEGLTQLERAATAGVLALAAGSFALSYDALHQLAVTNNVPRPLAWIWPLIVDGFITTASLAVLHALLRQRSTRYPWLLVLLFSSMSVAFNVLHAPSAVVARLVAAVPPLTLVLSFELLMRQLCDRLSTPAGPDILVECAVTATALPPDQPPADEADDRTAAYRPSLLQQARQIIDAHRHDDTKLTGKTLGQILGISDGYARRLLRQITANRNIAPGGKPARHLRMRQFAWYALIRWS